MSRAKNEEISLKASQIDELYTLHTFVGRKVVGTLVALIQSEREVSLRDLKVTDEIETLRTPTIPVLRWFKLKPSVVESYRGRGIGRMMLEHFLKWCREMEIHEVHGLVVQNDLKRLPWILDWYRRCGFEVHPPDERCIANAVHMIVWRNDNRYPSGGGASNGSLK